MHLCFIDIETMYMGALHGIGSISFGPVQNIILTCTFVQTDLFLDSVELYA